MGNGKICQILKKFAHKGACAVTQCVGGLYVVYTTSVYYRCVHEITNGSLLSWHKLSE